MLLFGLLLMLGSPLAAQDLVARGFDHFFNLEFDQAIDTFSKRIQQNPNDPGAHNHLAQSILYREMLRSGALESEMVTGNNPFLRREKLKPSLADQQRLEKALQQSIELTQAALSRNGNDVDAMYAQGVAYGLRGNYNFLVKKAWTDALRDLTTGRKLHNRVTELRPSFVDAKLMQGVHDYVVGSLPWTYKMLGFIVGFRGDREGGIRAVQEVARSGDRNKADAKVLLAAVYRRERRPADAIPLIKELLQLWPRNYLLRLEMVQMYGDLGDKQKALEALTDLEKLKRQNTPGLAAMPFEKINFARGNLLFWYREYDWAIEELKKATAKAQDLDFNAAATAYLRLGQCLDMKQQRTPALAAYRSAVEVAPDSDPARQAKNYLSSPYKRGKT